MKKLQLCASLILLAAIQSGRHHHFPPALRHQCAHGQERCPGQGQGGGNRLDPRRRQLAADRSQQGQLHFHRTGPGGRLRRRQRTFYISLPSATLPAGPTAIRASTTRPPTSATGRISSAASSPAIRRRSNTGASGTSPTSRNFFARQGHIRPAGSDAGGADHPRFRPGGVHRRARA